MGRSYRYDVGICLSVGDQTYLGKPQVSSEIFPVVINLMHLGYVSVALHFHSVIEQMPSVLLTITAQTHKCQVED